MVVSTHTTPCVLNGAGSLKIFAVVHLHQIGIFLGNNEKNKIIFIDMNILFESLFIVYC